MTIDEIKGTILNVSIINKGKEGEALCYKVNNDTIGEFIISNCYYNTDPTYFSNAKNHLNGTTTITLSDNNTHDFFAVLTIDYEDSSKGQVILRC